MKRMNHTILLVMAQSRLDDCKENQEKQPK